MATLLDAISGVVSPQLVSQLAGRLGEPEANVSSGVQTGLTAILAALASRSGDGTLMRNVVDLARRFDADPAATSPAALLDGTTATPTGAAAPASGLLSTLVGGGAMASVADALGKATGLRTGSASTILSVAMPLALGLLGRRVREDGLDASGLASLLGGQRGALAAALPAGLASALGISAAPRAEPAARTAAAASANRESRNWLVPALLGLAALLLIGFFASRRDTTEREVAGTVAPADTSAMVSAAPATAPLATDTAATATAGMFRQTLPNGYELNVPATGIEARLVRFITNPAATVDDTTWFDFDRLLFETGSATLTPESRAQLTAVAQILNAYPKVRARIGGYTDNTGDSLANVRLSQSRAETVARELEALGVEAGRLDAEGYGAQHPVADNTTAEGRAQNRRIALRVTAK